MADKSVTYEQLIRFAAGELDADAAARVERRLASWPEAREVVRRFQAVVETLRADDSVAPPAELVAQLKALFADRSAQTKPAQPGLLETAARIIADLVYDSRPHLAMPGVRGATTAFQLSYECERADVDLDVEPMRNDTTGLFRVAGQITPSDESDVVRAVAFVAPGTTDSASTIKPDPHGVFSATISNGKYDLVITLSQTQVVLPSVEIE